LFLQTNTDPTSWTVGFRFQARNDFTLHHNVQTGSGAHPASYPMSTGVLSWGVKWPGREANHSPPSSTETKNVWSYTSTPTYVWTAWCLVKLRANFAFYRSKSMRGLRRVRLWTTRTLVYANVAALQQAITPSRRHTKCLKGFITSEVHPKLQQAKGPNL
jgi:hypothetical protein